MVVQQAIPLIAAQGVAHFTLADASVRAGLARYRASSLFASRAAVLIAVAAAVAERFKIHLPPVGGASALVAYVDRYCALSQQHPEAVRALHLIHSQGALDPELRAGLKALTERKQDYLAARFADAVQAGELRIEAPRGEAALLLATLRGLVASWLATGDDEALNAGCDQLTKRLAAPSATA